MFSDPLFKKTALAQDSQKGRSRPDCELVQGDSCLSWWMEVGKPKSMLGSLGRVGTECPVMRNRIDIDHSHSRAIRQEIGERLQRYLRAEPELPASIGRQLDRLARVEVRPPSIVPEWNHGIRSGPKKRTRAVTLSDAFLTSAITGVVFLIEIGIFVALGLI